MGEQLLCTTTLSLLGGDDITTARCPLLEKILDMGLG